MEDNVISIKNIKKNNNPLWPNIYCNNGIFIIVNKKLYKYNFKNKKKLLSDIKLFSYSNEHYLCSNIHNKSFGYGSNKVGQLGFSQDVSIFVDKILELSYMPINPIFISCGLNYTMFIDEKNNVYGCGSNLDGQLGLSENINFNFPVNISHFHANTKITHITCSKYKPCVTYFIDQFGISWSCGNGNKEPQIIDSLSDYKIKKISLGKKFVIALDEIGNIYAKGNNKYGQLGLLEFEKYSEFILVDIDIKIKNIECGKNHTIILDNDGYVYSSGDNKYGQLGITIGVINSTKFIKIEKVKKIITISCCDNTTFIIDKKGNVYFFGFNDNIMKTSKIYTYKPTKIKYLPKLLYYDESVYL